MSQTKDLLKIDYHTDDETGIYYIGEVDFGICGTLDDYLKYYGLKGKEEIVKTLAYLIYAVEDKFRNMQIDNHPSSGNAGKTPTKN